MELLKKALFRVNSFMAKTLVSEKDFEKLKHLNIQNVDGNEFRFKSLKRAILLLPDSVLAELIIHDVKIIFSKDSAPVENGKYAGWYRHIDQTIYIWDNGALNVHWQINTALHEIGHFVDMTIGGNQFHSCIDKDFHELCLDEQKYYAKYDDKDGNYYTSNIREYFAQSFAEYYLIPDFKSKCPGTTVYIEEMLKKIA